MRSTDHSSTTTGRDAAARFGALVADLARRAGYDIDAGGGGRVALARTTGMSTSAVGRMVRGETLPQPQHFESIARAVGTDVRDLLVAAGVISPKAWPKEANGAVVSGNSPVPPLSPEDAADMWGIQEPGIRSMLIASVRQAMQLQAEADSPSSARGGGRR